MKKYTYNLKTFTNEDAVSYYLLGAFCTDGSIFPTKCRASITSKDHDWILEINKLISPEKSLYKVKNTECYTATYNSKSLVQWFILHNCTPRKSLTLKFPDIPNQFLPDFIRGCWDGDGSLGIYRNRRAVICTSSQAFAKAIAEKLLSLDIKTSTYVLPAGKKCIIKGIHTSFTAPHYRVCIQKSESILNFCEKIYYSDNPISMKRKLNISNTLKKNILSSTHTTTKNQIQEVLKLHNSGFSNREIAKTVGFSRTKVGRILKVNGAQSNLFER